uniref:Uncharacterized protein n=1 Tax=Arundo donax TaxID=35708 RepID=A0A0A8Z275_ARUDO
MIDSSLPLSMQLILTDSVDAPSLVQAEITMSCS